MTRLVPIVIGAKPTVNLFRSIRHEAPANANEPLSLRWEHMVERAKFVRAWVRKMERRALRLVRP